MCSWRAYLKMLTSNDELKIVIAIWAEKPNLVVWGEIQNIRMTHQMTYYTRTTQIQFIPLFPLQKGIIYYDTSESQWSYIRD